VLVVEDNPDVAAFACSLLQELGYATHSAGSAAEALAMLADGARVDAVFSDIVMPGGMSGIELAAELRASYPRIGLVLASGYSALIAQGGAPEGVETPRKPYRLDELAVALGHALARASAVAELQAAE
jgi:CheY-like chemotaxis protein